MMPTETVTPVPDVVMSVQHLNVVAGKKKILDDVSIDFSPRSLTAVIGPSGCGKTTFIRCLNRMVEVTPGLRVNGSVLYLGQDIYNKMQRNNAFQFNQIQLPHGGPSQ